MDDECYDRRIVVQQAEELQRRKQQVVRDAIWESALELFERGGYEGTTVEEIAAAAGVSRRTFFRYYASKGDLMTEGVASYGAHVEAVIGGCPAGWGEMEVVRKTVVEVARGLAGRNQTRQAMAVAARSAGAREAQMARMGELQERVAGAFARRRRKKRDEMAPALLAWVTLSVLSVTFRWWFEHEGAEIGEVAERAMETMAKLTGGAR